jgi:hypothetical protein
MTRDALTGRGPTFGGDGCHHDKHRPQIHDPDDQEDRYQIGTAVAAPESQAQAVSPSCAGFWERTVGLRCLPAARKAMRLPHSKLEPPAEP